MQRPKNPPRGTYDLLPGDSGRLQYIESVIRETLNAAAFSEIRTPIFESTEIFERSAGEASDIVNKELYTFLDRSDRSLSLRPEGTAGVVRAYLSNGLDRTPKPVKLWYMGPMFRYERSQTGRYRQFMQAGLEVFGSESVRIEFESIMLALNILERLGLNLSEITLEINTLGDPADRGRYQGALQEFLKEHQSEICEDCQSRIETNPLRALDCKNTDDQALYQSSAPKINQYLSEESKNRFTELLNLFEGREISYLHNNSLVRGLDYYTETVFEIKVSNESLAGQNTICAGGRYDNLVSEFGGESTPAFGWAFGLERLNIIVQELDQNDSGVVPDYYLIDEAIGFTSVYDLARMLREKGYVVSFDYDSRPAKKQFDLARKHNSAGIISCNADKYILKKFKENIKQEFTDIGELMNYIKGDKS